MRRVSIFLVGLTVFASCSVFNEDQGNDSQLYSWHEITRFKNAWITALSVTENDDLYLAQSNELYVQKEGESTFYRLNSPDSADITRIRDFKEKLFIIGDVYQRDLGDWGRDVSYLYLSNDGGTTWEEIIGGFIMQDITFHENRIHIGRKHGVTTIDYNTREVFTNSFIHSELSDHIEEIKTSKNGEIVVASHDGLHISNSQGQDWSILTHRINKDDDWIRSIEFDSTNKLYALQANRTYILDMESGEIETIRDGLGNNQHKIISSDEIVKAGDSWVQIAKLDEMIFNDITPKKTGNEYFGFEFVDSFSDGRIIIAGLNHFFIGSKNH